MYCTEYKIVRWKQKIVSTNMSSPARKEEISSVYQNYN
jgi:hypothetical protein